MKRVATGRKKWLFKGSLAAGVRSANLLTLTGLALRNDLDVQAYLLDVPKRSLDGETDWAPDDRERRNRKTPSIGNQRSTKKARQASHRAGFVDRFGINRHSRHAIPASPSRDESVVDVVNEVKVVILISRINGLVERHFAAGEVRLTLSF